VSACSGCSASTEIQEKISTLLLIEEKMSYKISVNMMLLSFLIYNIITLVLQFH